MQYSLFDRGSSILQQQIRSTRCAYAIHFSRRPVIKVYGLLRTGTNYVTKLLELNFRAFTLLSTEEGWKHGPCQYSNKLKYVFLVKNPYSWIISFYDWEKIHGRTSAETLEDFILDSTSHPILRGVWDLGNPIEAWNKSLRSWIQLKDRENVVFLRYEDLLESFDNRMLQIKGSLNLEQRLSSFQDLETRVDNWKTPSPRKKLSRDYYQQNKFIEAFSESDLALMRQYLDPEIVTSLGYTVY